MSIIMNKKRKEPVNKVAIRLACTCTCMSDEYICDCGCDDTTPKYGNYGRNEAMLCGIQYHLNLSEKDMSIEEV